MNAIALQRTIADYVAEYNGKIAALPGEIAAFEAALDRLEISSNIGGQFAGSLFYRGRPSVDEGTLKKALRVSGWKSVYSRLNIDMIASAADKAKWERTISDPPELTVDSAVATFGDYLLNARWHILRGLAECFAELDPAYKSHSKVKIGVKGLPKRVILSRVGNSGSWGRERLRNMLNALAAYQRKTLVEHSEFAALDALHGWNGGKAGTVTIRGLEIRKFGNGNAHVIFDKATLLDINRALAEFYGEVLPDAEGEEPGKPAANTSIAKDLQYYPTPAKVIEKVLDAAGVYKPTQWSPEVKRVLEPSCGDGRFLDAIRTKGHTACGYEVHAGRADEARRKGHAVISRNFLEVPAAPTFDVVVMNPPFYGRHYLTHVRHALKFLKPGGVLVAVLPATAHYDHGQLTGELKGTWHDLPVASFSESGTNVPTGYHVIRKPD